MEKLIRNIILYFKLGAESNRQFCVIFSCGLVREVTYTKKIVVCLYSLQLKSYIKLPFNFSVAVV